ncbi:MAG: hypothetical protein LBE36_02530 [Flavobacteriaceae bacterium]|jgi:hypothetical protein|nr:hypothetical protein [Flavobacteriaceae bacterium]
MKTKISILTITLLLTAIAIASCGEKTSNTNAPAGTPATAEQKIPETQKRIPFERGNYTEVNNTMGMEIKKTVYFDKWGDWTASEMKSEIEIMKGYTHKTDELEIVKGNTHWKLDLIKKTGTAYDAYVPLGGMSSLGISATTEKMMEGVELKDLGEEEYLGYKCKKTYVKYPKMEMELTMLAYGNLTMKMEGKMGKIDVSTQITSIDLTAPPASIFEVPEGIKIEKQ